MTVATRPAALLDNVETGSPWAHSWAQFLTLETPRQFASHGSRAESTGNRVMVAETVPKTVPTELALGVRRTRSASAICS